MLPSSVIAASTTKPPAILCRRVRAMDIKGEIPELVNLTYLWNLDLEQNYLTGPFPAFLANLTNLQYLGVGANKLTGPVPKEIGNLLNLVQLSFHTTNINGTLPEELGNLRQLQEL